MQKPRSPACEKHVFMYQHHYVLVSEHTVTAPSDRPDISHHLSLVGLIPLYHMLVMIHIER